MWARWLNFLARTFVILLSISIKISNCGPNCAYKQTLCSNESFIYNVLCHKIFRFKIALKLHIRKSILSWTVHLYDKCFVLGISLDSTTSINFDIAYWNKLRLFSLFELKTRISGIKYQYHLISSTMNCRLTKSISFFKKTAANVKSIFIFCLKHNQYFMEF